MSELQIFENDEFGSVRTMLIDNEPWFVGKDVAVALGYAEPRSAVSKKVEAEDRGVAEMETPSGIQEMTIINESGLYSLILSSKLESAKKFKRWVTSEILPSIRKHGAYMTDDTINQFIGNPDFGIRLLTELKLEREKRRSLEIENFKQTQQITELKPKAEYHDNVLNKDGLITSTVIAKDLGLRSAMELHKILCRNKIIFKNQSGIWCPYADYEWLIEENYCDYKSYEDTKAAPCLKWTEKGRKWINENFNAWKERCCA